MSRRVVVAMSGGVDSSTTAWILKEKGYEVIGATLCLGTAERGIGRPVRCCSLQDMEDGRRVAIQIGIPFNVFYVREEFEREVIGYFCEEYLKGRTPNPCIVCNKKIKFGSFLKKALEMGADYVATGHYARLEYDVEREQYVVRKGVDARKDQSYVLFSLEQCQLRHTLLPLGEYRKDEVRRKALACGLKIHDKPESQEVCFIHDGSYHSFLRERLGERIQPGPIIDQDGNVVGRHKGIPFYTIGQRRGLGLARGIPLYVTGIDPARNAIIVGRKEDVLADTFTVRALNWMIRQEKTFSAQVRIRSNHPGAEAVITSKEEDEVEVRFRTPQKAITPGQAAVFYDGETVIGGGWIDRVFRN